MSYAAKVIGAGVGLKALLMGVLVSLLATTATFAEQIVLVLVSAAATGVFGLVIVLVQAHEARTLHSRIDTLEEKGTEIVQKAAVIEEAVTTGNATAAQAEERRQADRREDRQP